jgi:predicted metal-binding membrane protein
MTAALPRQSVWRRTWWMHPELSLAAVAAVAWIVVLAVHLTPDPDAAGHHHGAPGLPGAVGLWVVMVTAMMLPSALPEARSVSLGGKWQRRQRGPALFAVGYLAVWSVVGILPLCAARLIGPDAAGPPAVAGALVVAAAWESTRWKRHCLRACHRLRSLPPDGWRADRASVRAGVHNGMWCAGSCGPMMVPMALAPHTAGLWLMVFLSAVVLAEKLLTRAVDHLRLAVAALIVAVVVVVSGAPPI